jgi:hypothetical protein
MDKEVALVSTLCYPLHALDEIRATLRSSKHVSMQKKLFLQAKEEMMFSAWSRSQTVMDSPDGGHDLEGMCEKAQKKMYYLV